MNFLATFRFRWHSRRAVVLGMLVLGPMNLVLQPCALAAGIADMGPARVAHGGYQTDPAREAASESQVPCLARGAHTGHRCDGATGKNCATADRSSADSPIKPTDRSSDLTIMPPATLVATNFFSRLPAACRPAPALPSPPGPSLNIWYCVYLK